jgi:hypothetical protein
MLGASESIRAARAALADRPAASASQPRKRR